MCCIGMTAASGCRFHVSAVCEFHWSLSVPNGAQAAVSRGDSVASDMELYRKRMRKHKSQFKGL